MKWYKVTTIINSVIIAAIVALCILALCEPLYPRTLDPDEILNYRIKLTHVVDGKIPPDAQSMTYGQSITMQWTAPTTAEAFDLQPVPSRYGPYTTEIIITISDSVTIPIDGISEYIYDNGPLELGEWQAQISASCLVDGLEEYGQYSDAIPFFVREPQSPPVAPRSITIKFE